ncbi:2559_t:CDS:2 [Entrophospora sp. SA101]|nr:3986_t:CDS:2 [Entrophospora sp. SA101]CAJ0887830.1 2559_t:CDS:2 [Entrophospora sp. SA101]
MGLHITRRHDQALDELELNSDKKTTLADKDEYIYSFACEIDRSNKINELSSRNENIGMELVFNDNSSGETDNIDMINSSDNTGNDDNIEEVIV